MIRLISFLFTGCFHKWKVIDKAMVNYDNEWSSGTAPRYTLQCEHCGCVKSKLAK
jgi:hypothetical protein